MVLRHARVLQRISVPRGLLQPTVLAEHEHYARIFPVAWRVTPYRKISAKPGGRSSSYTRLAALIDLSYKGRKVIDSDTDTVESGERETKKTKAAL